MTRRRLGFLVNPIAGMGGPVALKGSDDPALLIEARSRGAEPVSPRRAVEALRVLGLAAAEVELVTYPAEMGASEAREAGLDATVLGAISPPTTAADTRAAAVALVEQSVDLVLFAGGDGTAADIHAAVGDSVPVLGIPAGVKMHSAVFAVNPRSAGELAARFLEEAAPRTTQAEVMDIDEAALQRGIVSPRLHGYLRVPAARRLVQSAKGRGGVQESAAQAEIAGHVVERVLDDRLTVLGPGTTVRAIADVLGVAKTLVGVDVVRDGRLVARDVDERALLELTAAEPARLVVTPVGGQGFLLGRGNQQLSPRVLEQIGCENIVVVATEEKIGALGGRPLLVDTGDESLDAKLAGYRRVIVGSGREIVYRIGG